MRLEGQPLQILATLVRQPGQIVARDEFRQQLWKDGTFVDFEHGLNAAMNRLRQVLGDSADQPRYIETMPGRGYRFVAAVQLQKPVLVMAPVAAEVEPASDVTPVAGHINRGDSELEGRIAAEPGPGQLMVWRTSGPRSGVHAC